MTRIRQLRDRSDFDEERLDEFDRMIRSLDGRRIEGKISPGAFSILMHSPGLAQTVQDVINQIHSGSILTRVEIELAALSTCRETDALYMWNSHTNTARNVGINEQTIDVIRSRAEASSLEPDDRDIVTFVRQLHRTHRVQPNLFAELTLRHSERWVVELAALVGYYQFLCTIINVFEVSPPPGADSFPTDAT